MFTRKTQLIVLLLAAVVATTACNKSEENKSESNATTAAAPNITVKLFELGSRDPIVLPPHLAKGFVEMLQSQPIHSEISTADAAPYGYFEVGDKHYLWHGNAVIYGEGAEEKLWHGPVTQVLINRWSNAGFGNLQQVVSNITEDDLKAVPLDGPGAHPGGTDGFATFEPK